MSELQAATAIGIDDLKVAEPVRPPAPETTLELDCRRRTRLLGRAPLLQLDSDRMTVSYPSLLREPLVVDRDDVIVAAVDTRRREGGETLRFPFAPEFEWSGAHPGDEAEIYGWLYVRGARSPLPFLSDVRALPNVAVVFREPLASLACRRRAARLASASLPGFFARVSEPEAARVALRDWGVFRPLTVADAERAGVVTDVALVR